MAEISYLHDRKRRRDQRRIWAAVRAVMESDNHKRKLSGKKSKSRWGLFQKILSVFEIFLKLSGLYKNGYNNVYELETNRYRITSPLIPASFNDYSILHLSDLHIDSVPGFHEMLIEKIKQYPCNICFITGDLRRDTSGGFRNIIKPLKELSSGMDVPNGIYAVLGNHDTYLMECLEDNLELNFLINETLFIEKNGEKIAVTGTDDPFRYFTDQEIYALEQDIEGFKIALVHTSELAEVAAGSKYSLYLCGHTHGGQICLPGGKAVITHQMEGKSFIKGLWGINGMRGFTHKGCGVSGIPVRYNCPGEIVYFVLRHGEKESIEKL